MWHVTHDRWQGNFFSVFFFHLKTSDFFMVLVLLTAHAKRFNVSHLRYFQLVKFKEPLHQACLYFSVQLNYTKQTPVARLKLQRLYNQATFKSCTKYVSWVTGSSLATIVEWSPRWTSTLHYTQYYITRCTGATGLLPPAPFTSLLDCQSGHSNGLFPLLLLLPPAPGLLPAPDYWCQEPATEQGLLW